MASVSGLHVYVVALCLGVDQADSSDANTPLSDDGQQRVVRKRERERDEL